MACCPRGTVGGVGWRAHKFAPHQRISYTLSLPTAEHRVNYAREAAPPSLQMPFNLGIGTVGVRVVRYIPQKVLRCKTHLPTQLPVLPAVVVLLDFLNATCNASKSYKYTPAQDMAIQWFGTAETSQYQTANPCKEIVTRIVLQQMFFLRPAMLSNELQLEL